VVRRERLDCCCTLGEFGEARGTNENPGRTTSALLYGMVVATANATNPTHARRDLLRDDISGLTGEEGDSCKEVS